MLEHAAERADAGWGIRWWRYERELDGHATSWLTDPPGDSPRGLVFDVFVNGTHPLLPWLVFFCVGIVLGRVLSATWWRPAAIGIGFVSFATATMIDASVTGERARTLFNDNPWDRSAVYVASSLGTALIAFATISWVADRYEHTVTIDWLRRAGQLSLTIYLGHALVFNLLVDWLEVVEPAGIGTSLTFALAYWALATAGAVAYQRRFGRGPAETIYRRLTL